MMTQKADQGKYLDKPCPAWEQEGKGAARQLPAQRWFLTEAGGQAAAYGELVLIRAVTLQLERLARPALRGLGASRGRVGTACEGLGRCGEMVYFESAHPPSFLGSHRGSRPRFLQQ